MSSIIGGLVLLVSILIMLVGLAGTVLPMLPGVPIIWAAMLSYGWYKDWADYGFTAMLVTGILVAVTLVLDQLASVLGSKKFGGSRAGMIGSVVGAILGAIFFNIIGLIVGTFLGAVIGEMYFQGRDLNQSLKSGTGALLGFLAGSLFKFMVGVGLMAYFFWAIIF